MCLNRISNYLNTLHGRSQRSNLSRLRLGTLDLEIEKGRWRNIPREERLCKICKTLEVENVEHFVLFCPALCQCRNLFMNNITSMNSNFASMSPENKIKYLFFNETLPHNILVLSANLLVALTETRRSLLNLKENRIYASHVWRVGKNRSYCKRVMAKNLWNLTESVIKSSPHADV